MKKDEVKIEELRKKIRELEAEKFDMQIKIHALNNLVEQLQETAMKYRNR